MPYLDLYSTPLTAKTAAHLLRRVTVGPTLTEISNFTGKTAATAYNDLLMAVNYSPSQPIIEDETLPNFKQTYLAGPFLGNKNFDRATYVKHWWLSQMTRQDTAPSLLEKLALFWQNHFVTSREIVGDYRFLWRYINLIRNNSLGNFRTFVKEVTKDPAMLVFLNGNENVKGTPNENYARELQELFTVGVKNFAGEANYTEDDVKEASRVLTGWYHKNYWEENSTNITPAFDENKHDEANKAFSFHYSNTQITGRTGPTSGDLELADLVNMLLAHPETAKYICRKLYKWYVNPEVTLDIETNVIIPLATFFKSPANDFAIEPVIKKLLTSQIFFDETNIGAIIKSPAEFVLGTLRFLNQPVPNMANDTVSFRKYFEFIDWQMNSMQMNILDQPSVFGYEPYYLGNLSKGWIGSTTLGLRNSYTDAYIWRWYEVNANYKIGVDLIEWAKSLQTNFLNPVKPFSPATTTAITAAAILEVFSKHLFVNDLYQAQKDFLIDTIMLQGLPRAAWQADWDSIRDLSNTKPMPAYQDTLNGVQWRMQMLFRYMLKMAEYQVF